MHCCDHCDHVWDGEATAAADDDDDDADYGADVDDDAFVVFLH